MKLCARIAAVLCASSLAIPIAAKADEALDTFNSLYGADLKRVASTRDAADDVALAAKLLTVAKTSTNQPGLLALLCENAALLGGKSPTGYSTAVEALELLAEKVPDKKASARQKLLALYQQQYDSARGGEKSLAGEALVDLLMDFSDEKAKAADYVGAVSLAESALKVAAAVNLPVKPIQDQIKELYDKARMAKQIDALKTRLSANPQDTQARSQLIQLHLVEFDNPVEAVKFLDASCDEATRTYLPLAAKDIKTVEETACLGLGEWYVGLSAKTTTAKEEMLERAKSYYEAYLDKHTTDDLSRTKAKLALEKVEETLARLNPPEDASTWGDLLKVIDIAKHSVEGKWEAKDGKLAVGPMRQARITVPVLPDGSYKMQIKFTRISGKEEATAILPVGAGTAMLVVGGYGGDTSGISLVNGKSAKDNETTVHEPKIATGQEQTVDVEVTLRGKDATITVELNGKRYFRWQGPQTALSVADEWKLPNSKTLGLGAMDSTVMFNSARMRMVSGEARLLEERRDRPTIVVNPYRGGWNNPGRGWHPPRRRGG